MWKSSNTPVASVARTSLKITKPWEEKNFEKTGRNQLAIYKGKKNCRWKISRDVSCSWSEGDINSAKVKGNSRPTIHSFIQRYLPMLALLARGDEWRNRKQNGVGERPSHLSPTLALNTLLVRSSWNHRQMDLFGIQPLFPISDHAMFWWEFFLLRFP